MKAQSGNINSHPDVQHFMRIPWCANLLVAAGSRDVIVKVHENRLVQPPGKTQSNQFVRQTLNTPDTIAAWVTVHPPPGPPPQFRIDESVSLIALKRGMVGFPGCLHGGAVALLFDEVTGMHIAWQRDPSEPFNMSYRTASLKATYLKEIPAPGTVLVRSRIVRVDGRKNYFEAQIEDEHGEVLAKGEVLYIALKSQSKI
ncbi:hypothetical protein PG989_003072 [Apiospora arundinis]